VYILKTRETEHCLMVAILKISIPLSFKQLLSMQLILSDHFSFLVGFSQHLVS